MSSCRTAPVVDVLRAVKEGAFVASDFPVILVLENHLPLPLQELLAQVSQGNTLTEWQTNWLAKLVKN